MTSPQAISGILRREGFQTGPRGRRQTIVVTGRPNAVRVFVDYDDHEDARECARDAAQVLGARGYAVTMASHGMGFTVTRKESNG